MGKRSIISVQKNEVFEDDVGVYFDKKGKSPHCMMELSAREWI